MPRRSAAIEQLLASIGTLMEELGPTATPYTFNHLKRCSKEFLLSIHDMLTAKKKRIEDGTQSESERLAIEHHMLRLERERRLEELSTNLKASYEALRIKYEQDRDALKADYDARMTKIEQRIAEIEDSDQEEQ
jgi:hypothetical protein